MIHQWSLKLMYLAVHDFNHRPARKEYNERHFCPKGNFPSYNYECRDAKYLVSWLPGIGMGASMRLSIITYVMVAIMNDRIPLFLSNVSAGPYYLRQPSQLFSCERFDSQCIFLPTTPCVLHISELEEAPLLSGLDAFAVRQTGQVPGNYSDDRVVVIDAKIAGGKFESSPEIMNQFRRKVRDRALLLVDEWRSSLSVFDENLRSQYEFLRAAADEIGDDPALPEGAYVYSRATNRIAHAILMYLLRPNPYAKNRLETELLEVFPQSIDPATTVGLPIRGSDKCGGESTCLEFHQYMQLAREIWKNISAPLFDYSTGQSRGKLVLTTEDATVYMQRLNFTQKTGFPLDIVVNQKDPMQGSGLAKKYKDNADHIMISSLLAIRMQLHAGYIYGNCCSNFHLMIFDLAKEGCGLTKHAICLQETKDYKVCCRWRKDEGCDDIRKEYDRLHPKTVAPMTLYSERNRGRHSDAPASIP